MKIVSKKLSEIMPYEKNPRDNDAAVQGVANSIKEFGFKQPIVIDKAGVIVAGHTRYKAAELLGMEEVPTIVADDLNPYQIAAYRLADNKVSEASSWDFKLLDEEISSLEDYFDMSDFGFELSFDDMKMDKPVIDSETYTDKTMIPQYEITGIEPKMSQLYSMNKTNKLIKEIKNSNITPEQKKFLIAAAQRHTRFNYKNIAEYYAHQDREMQELMEKSALVIIDYDDAIRYGYSTLKGKLDEIRENDLNEG